MTLLEQLAAMVAEKKVAPPVDEDFEKGAPFLWEMMTVDKWGDGSDRILPQIVIDRVPGGFKATLNDHSLCIRKSCLVPRVQDLLTALEKVLADQDVPWESFKSYRKGAGPKVAEQSSTSKKKKR